VATSSAQEFEDDTAFERLVLDRAIPLVEPNASSMVIDLRGRSLSIGAATTPKTIRLSVGGQVGDASSLIEAIRPLLFGSAWKVLDLLVEYAMAQSVQPPNSAGRYRIDEKVKACQAGLTPPPECANHPAIWSALTNTYAATENLRHTLVHRQALVGPDGSLTATTQSGQPAGAPWTADEQEAFCRAAQRAARAILRSALDNRDAGDLAFNLDKLASHHRQSALGGVEAPRKTVVVQVTPQEALAVDVDAVRAEAQKTVPDAPYYDPEIHLSDGRVLAGRLEDAETSPILIDEATPPTWLEWT
jgi:hypothetical protein